MAEEDKNDAGPRARAAASPRATPGPAAPGQPRDPPRSLTDSLITGVLLKYGHAPLEFKAQGVPSYFVTVQTERGERTLWGRGLERALTESRTQPRPGEAVGIRENGIDPMVVVMRERDAQGQVRLEKRVETPRGHWVIERREFFDERASAAQALRDPRVSRREAVRNHPELIGAYWALDSAGKVAEARIANPESRQRFVALVREALAHATERGEALPSARQQARSDANPQSTKDQSPQRNPDRTR
jgi:hypothetical protein